jgi:4-amino-4-deoxy-L-arabinose transferase-like glycosyltransferase
MGLTRKDAFIGLGIFFYGLVLFTIGLDHQEVIGFESRFYLFALEMWRHGPSWFPTTYQQPYPDYPGLGTYFIFLFARLAGELNKFVAILPSAIAASATLVVTYCIGALRSRRWGICAVFFLLFTNAFVAQARTISLDQYTTLITTLCFYLACSASMHRKFLHLWWILPLLVIGFAVRGPIGLVIPTGVLCVFYFLEKDVTHFIAVSFGALILLVLCGSAMLGLAYTVGGNAFVHDVLQMQVSGRLQDFKPLPLYFYFVESFGAYAVAYPVALLVVVQFLKARDRDFLKKLLGWALVILIGLSIPSDKKVRYILPMAPALALICGYLVSIHHQRKYFHLLQKLFCRFCLIFPVLCLVVLVCIQIEFPALKLAYPFLYAFFTLMQLLMLVIAWQEEEIEIASLFLASFVFVMAYAFMVETINVQLNQSRNFVVQVENIRHTRQAKLVFYREGKDALVIKYLANMPTEDQPIFIQDPAELTRMNEPALFVATEENYQQLPPLIAAQTQIVLRGRLGREPFVVFSKTASPLQGAF